jgi:hypothetical protein
MRSGTINSASKAQNKTQRLEFVKYWADYVRTHPDKDWSKQQAVLVDSMLAGTKFLLHRRTPKVRLMLEGARRSFASPAQANSANSPRAQELSKKGIEWDPETIRKLHERKLVIK